jgi:predicted deacylase
VRSVLWARIATSAALALFVSFSPSMHARAEVLAAASPGPGPAPVDVEPRDGAVVETPAEVLPPFIIGDVTVMPGEEKDLLLQASESFSGGDVKMPVVVIHGTKKGPVLCLTAGIHGDELNGIEIVREVMETNSADGLAGTIVGIPILNLFGFWNQSRYLPDRRDLNRHFPGRPAGSTASRIAFKVWSDVITKCTHLIDFHTGSLHRSNLPQVRADLRKPVIEKFARAFHAEVTVHNPGQRGTLRFEAAQAGIPSLLFEAGEPMRFQRRDIRAGVIGVQNVIVALGMRGGQDVAPKTTSTFLETRWVRAQQGGIVEIYPSLGENVVKGDVVGIVTDPLRRTKGTLIAPFSGRVIGKVLAPTVIPGIAVLHLGIPDGKMERSEAASEEIDLDRPE